MVPDGYLQCYFYQYPVNDYDSAVPGGAHLAHLDSNHGVFCADAADGNGLLLTLLYYIMKVNTMHMALVLMVLKCISLKT